MNVKKPITTSPTAKEECAKRPSKASPGRLVLFEVVLELMRLRMKL